MRYRFAIDGNLENQQGKIMKSYRDIIGIYEKEKNLMVSVYTNRENSKIYHFVENLPIKSCIKDYSFLSN